MDFAKALETARGDLVQQDPLYQPTAFWARASDEIAASLLAEGIERFRYNPRCLGYCVPNYGPPTSGISTDEQTRLLVDFRERNPAVAKATLALEQMLSGRVAALADLRVLQAADDPRRLPRLDTFSESGG